MVDLETYLDSNGQPPVQISYLSNQKKAVNILYGIMIGITADGVINDHEVCALRLWLNNNKEYIGVFPLDIVNKRVEEILADGIMSEKKKQGLCEFLSQIIGGNLVETGVMGGLSTRYGMDEIERLFVTQKVFCFTGAFAFGSRAECQRVILNLGGITSNNVTLKVDYLVVGGLSSRDWVGSSHGRKIETAINLKKKGSHVKIIPEEIWVEHICTLLEKNQC